MAKSGNQKGKLLYLAEIFHRETDEAHGLTLAERRSVWRLTACRRSARPVRRHGGAAALRGGTSTAGRRGGSTATGWCHGSLSCRS